MKKKVLVFLFIFGFLLVGFGAIQLFTMDGVKGLMLSLSGSDNTTYAPNYTDSSFHKIKVGMLEADVRTLIGEPMDTMTSQQYNWWFYSSGSRERTLIIINGKVAEINTGILSKTQQTKQ